MGENLAAIVMVASREKICFTMTDGALRKVRDDPRYRGRYGHKGRRPVLANGVAISQFTMDGS